MAEAADPMPALIANSAKTDPRMWEAIGNIPKAYWEGQNQRYQQDLRNAFKDDSGNFRADLLDKDGNPDSGKMYQRLMTIGGAPAVEAASKLAETGFQQDRYRNAPTVQQMLQPGGQPQGAAVSPAPDASSAPPTQFPPSANRGASVRVAPALAQGGVPPQQGAPGQGPQAPQGGGDRPGSLMGFIAANGIPEQDAGSAANIIGGQIAAATGRRFDPNAPLNMADPAVANTLAKFARQNAAQSGQPLSQGVVGWFGQNRVQPGVSSPSAQPAAVGMPQQSAPQPQVSAAARPASNASSAPPADPTLGGLIPPGYPDPGAYVQRLEAVAGSGRVLPDQLKVLQGRIEAIHKALEPTPDMKNARAAGMGVREYLDRNDTASTERAILTNSILPKLDKSQDTAIAARDDIKAINQAREELDRPGGIFSGAAADVRLKVAKVAEFLGVPNTDKIANTEAFNVPMGQRTLALVKGLGAGTGISNADRDFAAQMAGGNIKLDEKSIRRILDISEKAARAKIDLHNGLATRTLKANDSLSGYGDVYRVDQPEQYQRAAMPAPKAGAVLNGFKYLGGNPNDRRSWGRI